MRWPANASLDPATRGTAKSAKSHRDLAEKRRYHMVPVVLLHTANVGAAWVIRPSGGVVPGLRGDDLLLDAYQLNCYQKTFTLSLLHDLQDQIYEFMRPINFRKASVSIGGMLRYQP